MANFARVKRLVIILMVMCAVMSWAKKPVIAPSYAWRVTPDLGVRLPTGIDTLMLNYDRTAIPSQATDAYLTTGNLGGSGLDMVYWTRPQVSDFFMRDALYYTLPSLQGQRWYNSRLPMTLVSYGTGGGRDAGQERLKMDFSGNVNARLQFGAKLDYLYSKGSYACQATDHLTWGFCGSYIGEKYQAQAFFYHYNALGKENGGIEDDRYITDPEAIVGTGPKMSDKNIPVRLNHAHSKVVGEQFWLNQRYSLGFHRDERKNDTTVVKTFVPVTSFIWTTDYRGAKHLFLNSDGDEGQKFFDNAYYNASGTRDRNTYWTLTNTIGVELLEGFSRWAQAGLTAYLRHQLRRYDQTADTLVSLPEQLTPQPEGTDFIPNHIVRNRLWVGAQLARRQGKVLNYNANVTVGLLGGAEGELLLNGEVSTRFPLLGDTVNLEAYGSFHNRSTPYLLNNYRSNHFIWHNEFGKERTYRAGGRLNLTRLGTHLDIGVANVQNHVYFGPDCLPVQHGGSVQVFSARLSQSLRAGILHWDNAITYQTSSDDAVLPLPKLVVYSNLYILFKIAKVMTVQLGADCDYYTRYYAPGYQPATMSFYNQRKVMCGNYPWVDVYANFKLSKARFYVLYSHADCGMGKKNYFSTPGYPLNPSRLLLGISVDFAN